MQMISSMPASSASRIESAAKRGGTKIIAVLAPSFSTAAWKVLKTGMPSTSWPPLPGVTPATTWVPYSRLRSEWNVPSRPVMPDVHSRVFWSTRMLMRRAPRGRELHDLGGGAVHRGLGVDVGQAGVGQQLAALLAVGAVQADHEGHRRA